MSKSVRAAPKKGGHYRVGKGHGQTTDSLDPNTWENGFMLQFGYAVQDYLTEIDDQSGVIPRLAESWEASADATSWTFKLKKGAEFHNGKTVEAQDVIDSINIHRGEDSKSPAKPIVDPIEDIKADNASTVTFHLNGGNADFPFLMSDYHLAIRPSTGDGIDVASPVGAGAYTVDSFDPGVRATGKRFANFHDDSKGHFDSFEILAIVDPTARQNALVTGEVDAIDRIDLKTAALLKRQKHVEVESVTGTQHYTFPMRVDTAPFDNVDVRLALKYSVDREALLKTVLKGYGQLGNDTPIAPANRFFNKDMPQRAYDPEKAKFHLKQAGLSELKVPLHSADAAFAGAVDAAVLYREHALKAGIDIEVVREPNDGYWSSVWMNKPWCACYWGGRPTEDWMFSTAYESGKPWNDTFWSNARFDELLVLARSELDDEKRRAMYYEMQEIVNMDGGVVVPFFAAYVFARSENVVTSENMAKNWDMDGERSVERWSFA
jgi:peptide/nickel transport system substrate-binding protein